MADSPQQNIKYRLLLVGFLLFTGICFFGKFTSENPIITYTAAIAFIMAFWWVTEALPIGVTSLLPIFLFPVLGVVDGKIIANAYVNYVIFLFIGGFFMALALERWGLHKRIALKILSVLGSSPFRILLGFMLSSWFLSMWISNIATTMMMLPIVFSVIHSLEEHYGNKKLRKFGIALLLAIAYSATVGGITTLVGTAPNLSFVRIFEIMYPEGPEIAFGQWLIFTIPISILMFLAVLLVLYFMFPAPKDVKALKPQFFKDKYQALGKITNEQKRVLALFLLLVFLWTFRKDLQIGSFTLPGWGSLFKHASYLNDGAVAIFISVLLFIIPNTENKKEGLLNWAVVAKIPWGIVLLFGGGFALATGFVESGLSAFIGEKLVATGGLSETGLLFSVTGLMAMLTEFTSNTATTEMMLPIISGLADKIQVNPLLLMLPITLAASLAFMFPVATPPNAVVFGTGRLKVADMVKAGLFINIIGIILVVLFVYFWGTQVFQINLEQVPDWVILTDQL